MDKAYLAALELVRVIDARLEAGYHFRDREGRVLVTLDQVMVAIIENRF